MRWMLQYVPWLTSTTINIEAYWSSHVLFVRLALFRRRFAGILSQYAIYKRLYSKVICHSKVAVSTKESRSLAFCSAV